MYTPLIRGPYSPFLYSKTGVYRGIFIFLIFDPKFSSVPTIYKHRLWVLIRTTVLTCTNNRKSKKITKFFKLKKKITVYCMGSQVFVMKVPAPSQSHLITFIQVSVFTQVIGIACVKYFFRLHSLCVLMY